MTKVQEVLITAQELGDLLEGHGFENIKFKSTKFCNNHYQTYLYDSVDTLTITSNLLEIVQAYSKIHSLTYYITLLSETGSVAIAIY